MIVGNKEKTALKTIKIIIWLLPVVLVLWLANNYILPSGKMKVIYSATHYSPLVRNFASKERDRLIGTNNQKNNRDYFQLITQNPLYFDVVVPRTFQSAKVTLEYQNPNNQPVIQAGLQQSNKVFYNQDLAYTNDVLNNMPFYWQQIKEGDIILWQKNEDYFQSYNALKEAQQKARQEIETWKRTELQNLEDERFTLNSAGIYTEAKQAELLKREKAMNSQYDDKIKSLELNPEEISMGLPQFASVSDFEQALNDLNKKTVVSHNYNLLPFFRIADYSPASDTTKIDKTLRGKHEIYTYLGPKESLNFQLTLQDINLSKGADPINISLYNGENKKIDELKLEDDSQIEASGEVKPERTAQFDLPSPGEGTYRILIDVNDDIFIKNISTTQRYLSFKGRVYLADNSVYRNVLGNKEIKPTILYTNSTTVNAQTTHETNLQTLKVNNQNLKLQKIKTPVSVGDLQDTSVINSPVNDVDIRGNAYFAFDKNQLLGRDNPDISAVNKNNVDDFDFIIANYPQAEIDGDWLVASTTFTSEHMFFDKGQDLIARFIINLPGLPENHRALKIKSVTVEFARPPTNLSTIFNKIKSYLKK